MSWTLVASGRGIDAATINSTGANVLIAHFSGGVITPGSWDNKGNTWTKLTERQSGSARSTILYCIAPSSVGASHTLTDPNNGVQDCEIEFYAFSASGTVAFGSEAAADDGTYGGSNTKSSFYAGSTSVTPASNDALIFAAVGTFQGSGVAGPFSVTAGGLTLGQSVNGDAGANPIGGASAYLDQATAAAIDPTISWTQTGTSRWAATIAVFTNTGGGGPPPSVMPIAFAIF